MRELRKRTQTMKLSNGLLDKVVGTVGLQSVQDLAVEQEKVQCKTKAEFTYFRNENVGQGRGLGGSRQHLSAVQTAKWLRLEQVVVNDGIRNDAQQKQTIVHSHSVTWKGRDPPPL